MAITTNDYFDLVHLLEAHPEWRADLRRLLLTDDILELPRIVRELAEAQQRTEARVADLAARMDQLAARMDQLAARMDQLAARMDRLATAQEIAAEQLRQLAVAQNRMMDDLSKLKGWSLEYRYRTHAYGYFGRWLRKARAVDLRDLTLVEQAFERGELTDEEWAALGAVDVFVQGKLGKGEAARDALLVVEVSFVADSNDVERAHRRAEIMRRLGYPATGAVGAQDALASASLRAEELGVAIVLDGRAETSPSLDEPKSIQAE